MGRTFVHETTRVHNIDVEEETIVVSATVKTMLSQSWGMFPGPDLDFTLELLTDQLADAYDLAVAKGHELFAEFNFKQGAR